MQGVGVYAEPGGPLEACLIAAIAALAAYNALLALTLREPAHYAYVTYAASAALVYATHFTVTWAPLADALGTDDPGVRWAINHAASAAALASALLFTKLFLGIRDPQRARLLNVGIAVLVVATPVLLATSPPRLREAVVGWMGAGAMLAVVALGLEAVARRQPSARIFLVAWLPLVVAGVLYTPVSVGLTDRPLVSGRVLASAHALEMLLLALALAQRLRLAAERDLRRQQALLGELRVELAQRGDVGSYRLGELLGEGGMGRVFRGTHHLLGREAAVKLLPPTRLGPEAIQAFEAEARITSLLDHPNIVQIYECGYLEHDVFYYAMELVHGASLQDVVDRCGPMPAPRAVHVLAKSVAALAAAHARGIVHRDIKPSNILVCRERRRDESVKVVDFGVAKPSGAYPPSGQATGTRLYMAPETLDGCGEVSPAMDVYALGAVGHFLLTGRHAFRDPGPLAALTRRGSAPPSVRGRGPGDCSPALDRLLMTMMSRAPLDRPDLATIAAGLSACPDGPWSTSDEEIAWAAYDRTGPAAPLRRQPAMTASTLSDAPRPA
ncbi:MAG: 7TM diverse intracellular signaling domain-containing protein [Sandaracinaceae bacterium]